MHLLTRDETSYKVTAMCINPRLLDNGVEVACRKCWQCIENRKWDWVGRCIAESETAAESWVVSLTYGHDKVGRSDHPKAAVLTYSDVQKFLKLLRKWKYPCRYICAGEYGSLKARAHWHIALFFSDKAPADIEEATECFSQAFWPHGFSYWTQATPERFAYVCKYIQKDVDDDEAQGFLTQSRFPPLGTVYFQQRALRFVRQGISPQDGFYSFRGVVDPKGKPRRFLLRRQSLDAFCNAFVNQWFQEYGNISWPRSPLIEAYQDRMAKRSSVMAIDRRERRKAPPRPPVDPRFGGEVFFSQTLLHWMQYDSAGQAWFWCPNERGEYSWLRKIVTERELRTSRETRISRDSAEAYSKESYSTGSKARTRGSSVLSDSPQEYERMIREIMGR